MPPISRMLLRSVLRAGRAQRGKLVIPAFAVNSRTPVRLQQQVADSKNPLSATKPWNLRFLQHAVPDELKPYAPALVSLTSLRQLLRLALEAKKGGVAPTEAPDAADAENTNRVTAEQAKNVDLLALLRFLRWQVNLTTRCCSVERQDGVEVELVSGAASSPLLTALPGANSMMMFLFNIRVTNIGDRPYRILGQRWELMDTTGKVLTQWPGEPSPATGQFSAGFMNDIPLLSPGETLFCGRTVQGPAGGATLRGDLLLFEDEDGPYGVAEEEKSIALDKRAEALKGRLQRQPQVMIKIPQISLDPEVEAFSPPHQEAAAGR